MTFMPPRPPRDHHGNWKRFKIARRTAWILLALMIMEVIGACWFAWFEEWDRASFNLNVAILLSISLWRHEAWMRREFQE